jgi:hypothetical protein
MFWQSFASHLTAWRPIRRWTPFPPAFGIKRPVATGILAGHRLAVAAGALFDSDGWGGPDEEARVSQVREPIEAVISRADLRAALTVVSETVPPPAARRPPPGTLTTGGPGCSAGTRR